MKPSLQSAWPAPTHSRWARIVAFAAILLVLFASFAQAAHVHGDFLPHHDQRAASAIPASLLAGDEASCPLCIAMHAAMLEQTQTDDIQFFTLARSLATPHPPAVQRFLHFQLFSRPPPAALPQPLPKRLA